ncbi:flavodoxin family protein [Hazenella coriacea]|uniref:flavodoxin family protein n=1 Tax=Hazenella coriacea TaxID=1179467 RepID=UPI001A9D2C11|nr:flavodoxin family protein [Hazenella coriacea]
MTVIHGSSRSNGNSELLTQRVCEGIDVEWIALREKQIQPIVDQRHTEKGFDPVDDDYEDVIVKVMESEILIFSTPLYWYGMSGRLKNFVDRWSQSLRNTNYDFKEEMKNKQAYVIITGGESVRVKALPLIQQFQYIFEFMNMKFSGYIIGKGSKPSEVLKDKQAIQEAQFLNQFLKSIK